MSELTDIQNRWTATGMASDAVSAATAMARSKLVQRRCGWPQQDRHEWQAEDVQTWPAGCGVGAGQVALDASD